MSNTKTIAAYIVNDVIRDSGSEFAEAASMKWCDTMRCLDDIGARMYSFKDRSVALFTNDDAFTATI